VQLGDEATSVEALPHHLIFDRCYLHGDAERGTRRGIAMNSRHTAVVDSYLSDFKDSTADSQAIAGWNGDGPFRIANNYLEAAGENVMFGGADPAIAGLVPADIEIVRNHFAKPLRWKKDDPSFEGTEWAVKNLFELKNARRVLIDGNLFEYNWPHAQNGFAILFTPRNQEGGAPWSVVEDVTFSRNLVRHVAAGINVLGTDDNHRSRQTARIAILDNVFLDVGGRWGNGRLFQLLDGTSSIAIDHNTAFQTGSILFGGDHDPHTGFVFQNNVVPHNEHGITGSGSAPGTASLERYFPAAVVRRNVIVGATPGDYPRDNFFPASLAELGLVGTGHALPPRLTLGARYAGTDGRAPGADLEALAVALDGIAGVRLLDDTAAVDSQLPISPLPHAASAGTLDGGGVGVGALGVGSWAAFIFWSCLLLLVYVYVGYPVVAGLRARLRPMPRRRARIEPTVSLLVIAHNEEDRIEGRIDNLLALDYPKDRLEIVIASDGSTDETVARALRYGHAGVAVRAFEQRRGKSATLNAAAPLLRGEIVLFADARQRFDAGSLRAIVDSFADPAVGAVSGELMLSAGAGTAGQGAAVYWRYEKFIRESEGRADSTVGATGAIYAIRRELFAPIPDDTILDDVLIPLRIVRQGYRVVFEPGARAYDAASATARQEFIRKARTCAGTFQLFAREPWLLSPWRNRLWFETVSHKALRLALPLLHAGLLVATLIAWGQTPMHGATQGLATLRAGGADPMYGWALAAQLLFYGAALVGYARRDARRRSFVFSVPCAICLLSWASLVGFARFVTNRQQAAWERAPSQARPART
jgi:cellulose synthase/poly-beta-1,6-N-acetylglucosamine synthase-like glycosyltransferase